LIFYFFCGNWTTKTYQLLARATTRKGSGLKSHANGLATYKAASDTCMVGRIAAHTTQQMNFFEHITQQAYVFLRELI
jgi:hypothetical protein